MSTSLVSAPATSATQQVKVASWKVTEERRLRGYAVEWAEPGKLLLSRGNHLYCTSSLDAPISCVAAFPLSGTASLAIRMRLAQRALRLFFYNVLCLEGGETFVTFGRQIGVFRDGRFDQLTGRSRACRVLRGGCAVGPSGDVFFGEYLRNPERGPIRIYRYSPGSSCVTVVHEFPSGDVRHVHGVYSDPFDRSLWCLTGDLEHECKLLRSINGFRTFDVVGTGDETWRSVSAIFTSNAVYYGMDAEFRTNHIYRIDKRTGERRDLGQVDGPIYYSKAVGDDLFFGVAAELCPSQVGRSATLWHVNEHNSLSRVVGYEKDLFGKHLMPGTLHFPAGPGLPNQLIYHAVALAGADNRTYIARQCTE